MAYSLGGLEGGSCCPAHVRLRLGSAASHLSTHAAEDTTARCRLLWPLKTSTTRPESLHANIAHSLLDDLHEAACKAVSGCFKGDRGSASKAAGDLCQH